MGEDSQGKCIFWLSGMAGTGKSTISRTVAQCFAEDGQLGASFFFKRGERERGNASRFFTTIATQTCAQGACDGTVRQKAIDADPELSGQLVKEQFEKLIFQPLSDIRHIYAQVSKLVIVIDALDECE
jgi:Mrp family chromosome partitioning ATPase